MTKRQKQEYEDLRELLAVTDRELEALAARKQRLQQQYDALLASCKPVGDRRAA